MKLPCATLAATVMFLLTYQASAQEYAVRVPAELLPAYKASEPEIRRLTAVALDKAKTDEDRMRAFAQLRLSFPHAALEPAIKLSKDPATAVAVQATRHLASVVVMMRHGAGHSAQHDKQDAVALATEALRQLLLDDRKAVREIAATSLTSMNDPAALDTISKAAESGKLASAEAVRYLTLSKTQVGAPYVEKILASEKGSDTAKVEAVGYLAPLPAYKATIRDKYLLKDEVPSVIRAKAASSLASSDAEFMTYGGPLAQNPKIPPEVIQGIFKGLVEKGAVSRDKAQLDLIRTEMVRAEVSRPDADLSTYKGQLDRLQERF
jgi:hypothetical protein